MRRSAFKPQARRGFTLVEVALAAVIGSMLLVSLIYTSREISRAVAAVYNETILQTVFRDLETDVDANIFTGLDGATDNNSYTGNSSPFQFASNALTITNMTSSANNFKLLYTPGTAMTGGKLQWSSNNGTSWRPMMSLGSRDMLANVGFNYGTFAAPITVPSGAASFTYDDRVDKNLLKIDAVLNKSEMVPFLMQAAYAPRATSWKWVSYSKQGEPIPPPEPGGSFYPMALKRSQINYTGDFNIFTGAGSGHFGWLSWNGDQSQTTLAENLKNPNSNAYVNPDDPDDHTMSLFDWVNGKVGVVNSSDVNDALNALVGKKIDIIAWDNNVGTGSNTYIQAAAFARVKIKAFDLPSKTITASFEGWVDNQGNLLPPTIINFTPTAGRVGRTVQVIGMNFDTDPAANDVRIGGTPATVTAAATNSLVITVPVGAATGAITVENTAGLATSSQQFVVLPPPVISGFAPAIGGPGSTVTISGFNFDTTPSANIVLFNGIQAVVNSGTATQLVVTVPPGATTGPISVTCNDNQTTLSADTFTVPPPPAITGFSPMEATEGQQLTINGSNFDPNAAGNTVQFNGVAGTVNSATENQILVTVPAGASTGKLTVIANGQTSLSTDTFTARPAPAISGFTPVKGGVNQLVTINGTNFDPDPADNTVKFNGTVANIVSASGTKIVAKVATGTTTGKITVQVGTPVATSATDFTFLANPAIFSFSPASTYVGQPVTIDGANFDPVAGNNTVKFNGVDATVDSATNIKLVVRVPAGTSDGPITVTVNGLTATSAGAFNVTTAPAPTITSFSPASAYKDQEVVITGVNFSTTPADNAVRFNGSDIASVTSATATELKVKVPANALSGPIQVTVNALTGNSPTNFTFIPPPSIINFNPPATSIGQQVTINGSGFNAVAGNNIVRFNGTSATVNAASANQLVVIVPPGATDGPITVTANGQDVVSSTPFDVTALPAPVIYGFTPSGTWVGNTVTISGVNFSTTAASNAVKFNGVAAVVNSATSTNLVVTVPSGATTGYITVTTNSLTSTSDTFVVTPAPMPAITSFTPTSGRLGTVVTITGSNFNPDKTADVVKFFNGVTATVSAATTTKLTVTVPAGTTTGPIQVTSWGNTATSGASFTALPMSNNVQPIALNAGLISGLANNTALGMVQSGWGVSNFVWLGWAGAPTDASVQTSLSTTPNSSTYVNPADASDSYIDPGDSIYAMTNTANATKSSVDNVKTTPPGTIRNLIVPVFDSANLGTGQVHVSGFALIQITDRDLNASPDNLWITFLRTCDSAGN